MKFDTIIIKVMKLKSYESDNKRDASKTYQGRA